MSLCSSQVLCARVPARAAVNRPVCLLSKLFAAPWRTSPGQTQLHCDDEIHQQGREPQAHDEYAERQEPEHPV